MPTLPEAIADIEIPDFDRQPERRRGSLSIRAWFGALSLLVMFAGGVMGVKLVGPAQDVASVRGELRKQDTAIRLDIRRDSAAVMVRVEKIEDALPLVNKRLDAQDGQLALQSYILCSLSRRFDPAGSPPGCEPLRGKPAP